MANLEFVKDHYSPRRAQRPHSSSHSRQIPDRIRVNEMVFQRRFPHRAPEH